MSATAKRLSRRALALAVVLAALPGCVLLDGREELTVEPPGTLYGAEVVRLRANGPCDEVSIEIDGEALEGSFEANRELAVPIALADGSHRLVVRARDGALPGATVERVLEVDNSEFTLLGVDPAPGVLVADRPFVATFTFAKRIDPAPLPEVTLPSRSQRSATVAVAEDRRSLTVALDGPLEDLGDQRMGVSVMPAGAARGRYVQGGPWRPPVLTVEVTSPPLNVASRAPFRFTATATGDLPPAAELWAGEHLVTALGAPPWDLPFDASAVPEGSYQLSVRAPGYYVHGTFFPSTFSFPYITVDSTQPRVIRCGPEESPTDQASVTECVEIAFSESVGPAPLEARLLVNGAPRATDAMYYENVLRLCPTDTLAPEALPVVQTVTLPPLRDLSGNPLDPVDCEMTLRPWCSRFGVTLAGIVASEVAFHEWQCGGDAPQRLLSIAPEGSPDAGLVRAWGWTFSSTDPNATIWTPTQSLRHEPGSVATDLGPMTWVERVGSGPGHVHSCLSLTPWPLNGDTGRDGRKPSGWSDYSQSIAWSEEDVDGGRSIRFANTAWRGTQWTSRGSSPRLAPASVADEPSVTGGFVAWVETVPGGVSQLRGASVGTSAWNIVPEVRNVDPAVPASEPAASSDEYGTWRYVAWSEGGHVAASALELIPPAYVPVGAPQVLNVDSTRAARSPRFDSGLHFHDYVVYWIEESAIGDLIWGARWTGVAWELLPGPVNAGAEGSTVRSFDVWGWSVVWADDAGVVRMRRRGW
jgi:hypothetical protein